MHICTNNPDMIIIIMIIIIIIKMNCLKCHIILVSFFFVRHCVSLRAARA